MLFVSLDVIIDSHSVVVFLRPFACIHHKLIVDDQGLYSFFRVKLVGFLALNLKLINYSHYFVHSVRLRITISTSFFGSLKLEIKRRSFSQNKIPDVRMWRQN